jgi:hypothetical protein
MRFELDADTMFSLLSVALLLVGIGWACFGISCLWTLKKFFGSDED